MSRPVRVGQELLEFCRVLRIVGIPDPINQPLAQLKESILPWYNIR